MTVSVIQANYLLKSGICHDKKLLANKNRNFLNVNQVLVRVQSKWNFHMLLVGVQNGMAIAEDSSTVSYEGKRTLTI